MRVPGCVYVGVGKGGGGVVAPYIRYTGMFHWLGVFFQLFWYFFGLLGILLGHIFTSS